MAFVRRYRAYPGTNCFMGHGALHDLDSDADVPGGLTEAQCQQRCDEDLACGCVTHRRSDGACWKRAGCMASAFNPAEGFTVYVPLTVGAKQAKPPVKPPAPANAVGAHTASHKSKAKAKARAKA